MKPAKKWGWRGNEWYKKSILFLQQCKSRCRRALFFGLAHLNTLRLYTSFFDSVACEGTRQRTHWTRTAMPMQWNTRQRTYCALTWAGQRRCNGIRGNEHILPLPERGNRRCDGIRGNEHILPLPERGNRRCDGIRGNEHNVLLAERGNADAMKNAAINIRCP